MYTSILSTLLLLGASASASSFSHGDAPESDHYPFKLPCDESVVALATGIHLNIVGQHAEFNGTKQVIQVETAQAGNTTAFEIAKGELLSDIQGGMNIRLFNQEIAPPGNPAIPGLAKYQKAQQTEQALAMGLTGSYAKDKSSLNSLLSDIKAGIKLNMHNLEKATSECEFYLQFPNANQMG